jgi:DNA-binding transcriptional regulator YdaS (Cro superfamily)
LGFFLFLPIFQVIHEQTKIMTKKITDVGTSELARFLGTTPGFAHQIKKGLRRLPPKDCQRVSIHFSIALHDLRPDIYPPTLKRRGITELSDD